MEETVKTFTFDQWGRIPLVHEKGDPGWKYDNGKRPGWGMPGGGPENGETALSAGVRETAEESGLIIQPQKKLFSEPTGATHQVTVFYSKIIGGNLKKESQETDDAGWFFYDELPEDPNNKLQSIYPAEKRRIAKAIEELGIKEDLKWLKWHYIFSVKEALNGESEIYQHRAPG